MRYVKPRYYDAFVCIADHCPATCCRGWQIVIDDDALVRYWNEKGEFGNRLKNSIDWESGTFCQYDGRCDFLNDRNLCDIHETLGEGALCDTCRRYPRHVEEFEGVREYSLTLSCPEAARRMLTDSAPMTLVEWETEEEETFEEGFDFLLYTQLADARKVVFRILQDRDVDMRIRMEACLIFAETMQELLDRENYAGVDDWIRIHEADYRRDMELAKVRWEEKEEKRLLQRKKEVEQLKSLEILDPAWAALLEEAESVLCQNGDASYRSLCAEFQEGCGYESGSAKDWALAAEQIAVFFIYTYFCGAVYDGAVYAKIRLMEFSVQWIQELTMVQWHQKGKEQEEGAIISLAYRFAREIEHSDPNRIALEEWLEIN